MNDLIDPARRALVALPILGSGGHGHFDFAAWSLGEWALFGSAALVTVWVLWIAVRMTVSPGEEAPDHVKRSILDDDLLDGHATPAGLSIRITKPREPLLP